MDPDALIVVFVVIGIIAFIAGIIWLCYHLEKKRMQALSLAAEERGLSVYEGPDGDVQARVSSFGLFNKGHSRKMKNVIKGVTDEVEIAIFDYQFTTGSGKHQHTHQQTVASLSSNLLQCPSFSLRPEGFFDKIGGALGFQDIDFETHPTFSKMFVLKGDNEQAVRAFFQPHMLEFFEQHKKLVVEARSGVLIFHRGNRMKPEQLKDLLADAYEVFGMMVDPKKKD